MKRKLIILSTVIPVLIIAIILLSIFMPGVYNRNHDNALDDIKSSSMSKAYSYRQAKYDGEDWDYPSLHAQIPIYVKNHEFLGYLKRGLDEEIIEIGFDGECSPNLEGEYSFNFCYQLFDINSTPIYKATLTTNLFPNYTFVAKNGKEQKYRTKPEKILTDSTIFETCSYKLEDKSSNSTTYRLYYYHLEFDQTKINIHSVQGLSFVCEDSETIAKLDAMCE